jgi:group I intron endonuclease
MKPKINNCTNIYSNEGIYFFGGIYIIRNRINNKEYVGSSIKSFGSRFNNHLADLRTNTHVNAILQNSWNKYGEDNFEFIILEVLPNDNTLILDREQYWIDTLNPVLNINKIAKNRTGMKHTEEVRLKMSNSHKGKKFSKKHRENISNSNKGRTVTEETRNKISTGNKGKKRSKTYITNLSIRMKLYMSDPKNRLKASKSHIGLKCSEETKRKMSAIRKGKTPSIETISKIRESLLNRDKGVKLTVNDVLKIKKLLYLGYKVSKIAKLYKVTYGAIFGIYKNVYWTNVELNENINIEVEEDILNNINYDM